MSKYIYRRKKAMSKITLLRDEKITQQAVIESKQETKFMDAQYFFQGAGDIVPLNIWMPENALAEVKALHTDKEAHAMSRNESDTDDHNSYKKGGIDLKEVPSNWGIPTHAGTVGSLAYDKGDFLFPHRDKWHNVQENGELRGNGGNGVRLICFLNKTSPTEFHFVVDGKITVLEPGRWYAVNTQRVHYGFSFVDDVYHVGCELKFNEENRQETSKFLLTALEFNQPFNDRKGVDCTRN
jgi:hypothetical protein